MRTLKSVRGHGGPARAGFKRRFAKLPPSKCFAVSFVPLKMGFLGLLFLCFLLLFLNLVEFVRSEKEHTCARHPDVGRAGMNLEWNARHTVLISFQLLAYDIGSDLSNDISFSFQLVFH
jgi:hypothetical protein